MAEAACQPKRRSRRPVCRGCAIGTSPANGASVLVAVLAVAVVLAVVIVVGTEVMEVILVDGGGVRHWRPISKVVVVAEMTGHVLVVLR
jgi:hypothetical protein